MFVENYLRKLIMFLYTELGPPLLGIGWLLLDFLLIVDKKDMTSLVKEQFLST
jgi:hypothetical protein